MSACLRILVPEETANYIQNPALRYDATGWTLFGSTITRSSDYARFNIASLKIVTSGISTREGAFYRVSNLDGVNELITASIYARGTGRVHLRLIDASGGVERVSDPIVLRTDRWQRLEVTCQSSGGNDMRLYLETDDKTQAVTFYADGAQMERKPYATTYCDGDQPGCKWNVTSHGSMSTRLAYTRAGGRWLELGGPCRREDDIYFTVLGGFGMASIVNNVQPWGQAPGSFFQNSKILNRVVTISFFAKKKNLRAHGAPSLTALHKLRQELYDVFKPDRTANSEPFLIEYTEGDRPLYGWFHYEGGMEGEWDLRNEWVNSFPVRLLAVDPFFFEDDQEIYALDYEDSTYFNGAAARINGKWDHLNYGFLPNVGTADGQVYDFAIGDKGQIYAAGSYRFANANVSAIDPLIAAQGISYWDGTQWNYLSTGANGAVRAVAVAPNGYVYVTGEFTSIGGVAANGVAYWNGAAWNAMGTGIATPGANPGHDIAVAPNGNVYIAGNFTSVGGANCRYCARWDGGMWSNIGAFGGLNAVAYTLAISADGTTIYFGGDFTDQFSLAANALNRVCKYTVSSNAFSAMSTGLNSTVFSVAISPLNGIVYAAGAFIGSGSLLNINMIAMWNGSQWVALGTGATVFSGTVIYNVAIAPNGDVIAIGQFTKIGGVDAKGIALWNGSSWVNMDITLAVGATPTMYKGLIITPKGDIFVGGQSFSTTQTKLSIFSGITTLTNSGSAEVRPVVYVSGSGILKWIENQTTGKRVYFNLSIQTGEEVFIDFNTGIVTSVNRGNLTYMVLPGSDFHSFTLLPGENKIAAFLSDGVGATMSIFYQPKHWSMDAVKVAEAL